MAERIRGRKGVALRRRRLKRTSGLCEHCLEEGRTELAVIVDHTVPLAHDGEDVDENTRNLCKHHADIATAEQFGFKKRLPIGDDGWPL